MAGILILSDIHGNKDALDAVIADTGDADTVWCLGDIVGYGPEPAACVDWVRANCAIVLSGNHDYAVFDEGLRAAFNTYAATAARWTRDHLSDADIAYLRALPSMVEVDDVTLSHGSPADPIWAYIFTVVDAREAFDCFTGDRCFVGHTHVAAAYTQNAHGTFREPIEPDEPYLLGGARYIINPGSVGQPRDRDPRAAYLWYDPDAGTVTWKRVPYDIAETQAKMQAAGLPERLAQRLSVGQ